MHKADQLCTHLFALPGLLGSPPDWIAFDLQEETHVSYWKLLHPELNFWQWSEQFNASIAKLPAKRKFLLGYSLGGRLAMHALIAWPKLWSGAIFISAHPGLVEKSERRLRLQGDAAWSQRFKLDPWEQLMQDWNGNAVFGDMPFHAMEGDFNRQALALQLQNWSLGHQANLLPKLQQLDVPMLFVAGACDKKFCLLAEFFKPFAQVALIPDSAHRVPWQQPALCSQAIHTFIKEHI